MSSLISRTCCLKPTFLINKSIFRYGVRRTLCQKADSPSTTVKQQSKQGATYNPDKIDKLLLVWMKKYPSVDAVPNLVTEATMEKVRSIARIKICTYLVIGTILMFIFMAYLGKRDAKRGLSIQKMNRDFHKSVQEKDQKLWFSLLQSQSL